MTENKMLYLIFQSFSDCVEHFVANLHFNTISRNVYYQNISFYFVCIEYSVIIRVLTFFLYFLMTRRVVTFVVLMMGHRSYYSFVMINNVLEEQSLSRTEIH